MRRSLARDLPPVPVPLQAAVVLGYVVVVTSRAGGKSWLTNSDLMDQDAAEYEAARWRTSAAGSGFRYDVCPVLEGAA